jgi:alpha-tubulin suppressor-like RCC1 family protein
VSAVFAAGNNTFAVKTDGSVWGWGSGGGNDWPFKTNLKVPTAIDWK